MAEPQTPAESTGAAADAPKQKFFEGHPVVFPFSAGLIVLFVVLAAAMPGRALILFLAVQEWIAGHFSWLYIGSMTGFLAFALWLMLSKFGDIRLGRQGERPEFPLLTWFAMLFSAGMGIGMLFWGVAEPMYHYLDPPHADAGSLDAARQGMGITMFHWGFHAWAMYAMVALSLAYFGFRRGLPLSFRSVFYPVFGDRIHGRTGDVIDIMAVLATLFGLATSLGLGAKQVNAGLAFLFGVPMNTGMQVILIFSITACAVVSLVSGLNAGIRRLSEINMGIAGFLLLFLFVTGPTVYMLSGVVENTGTYLQRLPTHAFWTGTYENSEDGGWLGSWTVFYWGWWIAWSPFVGMFIARVSRGRTIRQFITGVLIVPTAVGIIWMTGFGNAALHQEIAPAMASQEVKDAARAEVEGELQRELNLEDESDRQRLDAAIARQYGYERTEYPVLQNDPDSGQPLTAEGGEWPLAIPNSTQVAKPRYYLARSLGDGRYETRDGHTVTYRRSVMVDAETRAPVWPGDDAAFDGQFKAEMQLLSLGGYLNNPVLNAARTTKQDTTATAMFVMLKSFPLAQLTALLGTLSIILFFITSSDSASLVADIIACGGNQDPPTGTRLFWGILEGCLAAVLLTAGGLIALQTGAITLGLPFCVIVIFMCYALARGLRRERAGLIPLEQQRYIEEGPEDSSDLSPSLMSQLPHLPHMPDLSYVPYMPHLPRRSRKKDDR